MTGFKTHVVLKDGNIVVPWGSASLLQKKKKERKREEPLVFFGKLFLLAQFFFLSMSHYDVKFTVLRIIEQWC